MSKSVSGGSRHLRPAKQVNYFETSTTCGTQIRVLQKEHTNEHGRTIKTIHGQLNNPNGSPLKNIDGLLHDVKYPKKDFHIFDEGKTQLPDHPKNQKHTEVTNPSDGAVVLLSADEATPEHCSGKDNNKKCSSK